MTRTVILFTGQWADMALDELADKAGEWGYQGLELCCWGDHFEVQRALSDDAYCQKKLDLLAKHDLSAPVVAAHRVGQAVADVIDSRHQALLPEYVWGDGDPGEVPQRAAEEMMATARAAQRLGASVLSGFSGSPLWSSVGGYPGPTPEMVEAGLADFAGKWAPILDVCRECGLKFALEVHPGQVAFDLYSAERVLEAVEGR